MAQTITVIVVGTDCSRVEGTIARALDDALLEVAKDFGCSPGRYMNGQHPDIHTSRPAEQFSRELVLKDS